MMKALKKSETEANKLTMTSFVVFGIFMRKERG
jgi:hypothetical protein